MITEAWEKNESGVLLTEPLLLRANKAGAFGEEIASSASTFLRFEKDIELDVSTDPGHRRQGLADHCVFQLLNDCAARGLTVHWDAQNEASRRMAETHGFQKLKDYAVYVLEEK